MRFESCTIHGARIIHLERFSDERGHFARSWCRSEFEAHGLNPAVVQCNISFNRAQGTLRGMHCQLAPHEEAKLVRCSRGALWDVMLDLRPHSPTYLKHEGVTLTADNDRMLYLPEGVFHGFLTLEDNTEVLYQMSEFHHPESAVGYRFDDPAFQIQWPAPARVISARDREWPDFKAAQLRPAEQAGPLA